MRKKVFLFLFVIICLFPSRVFAFDTVAPTSDFYVNDYANILSSETENYILEYSISLYKKTNAQIVVVTIPSLNGTSIEEYATKLFREFEIGNREKDNGLLILFSLEERKIRIEVGYGLEGILPDGKVGRICDEYMISKLEKDNVEAGINKGYQEFYNIIMENEEPVGSFQGHKELNSTVVGFILFTIISFGLYLGRLVSNKVFHKKNKTESASLKVGCKLMIFLLVIECILAAIFDFILLIVILLLFIPFFGIPSFLLGIIFGFLNINVRIGYSSDSTFNNDDSRSSTFSHGGGGSSGGGGASRKF